MPNTDVIEAAQYPVIMVPFAGSPVPVMVRELTEAQIIACGEFSLIETFQDKLQKKALQNKPNLLHMIEFSERQHEVCKRALVKPTYDEIVTVITDKTIENAKSEYDALREKLKETPKGPIREKLEREINELRIWTDLILPSDFTAAILAYALGVDKSDIKELSEDALIHAAILAERGHDNPSDHMAGAFTDFMRDDINARAWMLLGRERDKGKTRGN